MKFQTRYRNAQLLFAISTIALMVFLSIWLKNVYEDKEREVDTEVSLLWTKSIQSTERQAFTTFITTIFDETNDSYIMDSITSHNRNISNISMVMSKKIPSKLEHYNSSIEVSIGERYDTFSKDSICFIDTPFIRDSHKVIRQEIQAQVPEELEKLMAGFSLNTDTLALVFDSLLTVHKLPVDYKIRKIVISDPPNNQDPFYAVTAAGGQYTLETNYPTNFLVQQMWFEGMMALLLLAMIVAAFYYILYHLKQQHQLVEIKNDLISNITHELRTPIFTVSAALEALENFSGLNDPQKTKEYLEISQNELNRLSLLVEKVLKTSLFEENSMTITKEPIELNQLVHKIRNSFKVQLERESATININSSINNLTLQADKIHLTNVLYNLIDNALKYKSDATPMIDIALSEQNNAVLLSITDNGIGIPKEYLNQIFDKFFRVPQGNKHNVKGYGLGLNYVSKIIAQHEGTITAESQVNKGTAFIITLPKH